ncbi:hypothetical protein AQUCO_04500216v1 [Aquilegia coerulea]|uniref:Transcription initiation factor TFIID subunit 1 n=1 Tax=Aquilegia coerulea TaxID=218851 RepID=A0A2G5CME9_AQUCA|nr:hypothetical protein AQUCO_04500216v1 [Aquilegia coerulea]
MGEDPDPSTHDPSNVDDDDDDEEYEEADRGNRLLGFMFGNVDGAGDLDVDYLDEDAKEHLAALAEKLGSSLTDINLSIRSSHTSADATEQDYDEKAEDAVDYEDIDEQYEGPEIQATFEEDHLLSKKEYFSAEVSLAALGQKTSVFDEENYDEDEDFDKEQNVVDGNLEALAISPAVVEENLDLDCSSTLPCDAIIGPNEHFSPGKDNNIQLVFEEEKSFVDGQHSSRSFEDDKLAVGLEDFQDEQEDLQEPLSEKSTSSLPVLYVEDGTVVLRFSEIFGIHEPIKKGEKRSHKYPILKEKFKSFDSSGTVEEDEEAFLRAPCQNSFTMKETSSLYDDSLVKVHNEESQIFDVWKGINTKPAQDSEQRKDSFLSAEPMKESASVDLASGWESPSCPYFCPLDQQDWENDIIWGNSPLASDGSSESCIISEVESEDHVREIVSDFGSQNLGLEFQTETDENHHHRFLTSYPIVLESFGSREFSDFANIPERKHPQQLRLESCLKVDVSSYSDGGKENGICGGGAMSKFSKSLLRNMDMLEDSWLEKIIWDPNEAGLTPKLILDLQDEQMLFEIPQSKDARHLHAHAGAMIIARSVKPHGGDSFDLVGQVGASAGRFNLSNDKYYSNRKTSQQLKSHSKKRTAHGVKVLHSIPALKLQTMKPKLSNKDIANFHRPKALWYPHDNEMAAKEQGKLCTQGPMKIILKSMGGKGSKLHVDAEETISSVKAKASKKLDFKPSEKVKIIYSGKELEDSKSLAEENVRPNSVLHLVRTKIHLWPKAQKLPGENKSMRPPGAFKRKADLSLKDGHAFLMEYCEERPLLLGNVGMGARLCTYYQKSAPGDQTGSMLRNGNSSLGNVLTLDPSDKSPFLGDIRPGCSQSCLETNMYRVPIYPHKLSSTDYLLVRSAKGKLSLRRIDRIDVVGQQEPHMEVMSPGTKSLQTYIYNRLLVYIYREFSAIEKRGLLPCIRADELSAQFPNLLEPFIRKRLKHCADLQRGQNGHLFWVMRRNFRIPLEEELRRMVTPETVCAYESMQAGLYRLKRLGISRLTVTTGLSSAMNQLPDEAIALAAASHIERELQITPWNLSSNFVACTNQDRENIERLEITGVGDPSGRGLGFSYVRVAPKAPPSSAVAKKKTAIAKGSSTVTGTDADLRRLSMEAAREVLLKFNVPEEQIAKLTRWHRIAEIRKLSSERAASGVKVDSTSISKYARGQRMSFLQLQQQTREKCQEIWDRQVQSLSAADEDDNDSDSEANSDLDSFAGDLENLLDAEECGADEVGNYESKHNKDEGIKGLKMRRRPSEPQAEEEIEDEAAEAAELCRMLMDDESERKKKKKIGSVVQEVGLGWQSGFGTESVEQTKKTIIKQFVSTPQPDGKVILKEHIITDPKEVQSILAKKALSDKAKSKKGNDRNEILRMDLLKNKNKAMGDGFKVIKEKKQTDKPVREGFVCGACGQMGHMRTNKNCPRYIDNSDVQVESMDSGKRNILDPSTHLQKTSMKKLISKGATRIAVVETSENSEKAGLKTKVLPLKLKCGPGEKIPEKSTPEESQSTDKQVAFDVESGPRSVNKINRIVISNKLKPEDVLVEPPKLVIKPPAEVEREPLRKKIIIKQPKGNATVEQVKQESSSGMQESYRKTKMMSELSSVEKHRKQEGKRLAEEIAMKRKANEEMRLWEEEEKRRLDRVLREESERHLKEQRLIEEQQRLAEFNRIRSEAMWKDDQERQKARKKKKKKGHEMVDEYYEVQGSSKNDRRLPGRERSAKRRSVVELGTYGAEYAPQTKRRRGGAGEVGLANILENVVDTLKDATEVSYLFLKPVSKKEAPDYLDIIKQPMDLSTIKEKVRKMEYKDREDFRHDVWQITFNAHQYNDGRNPGIPPLADQLLELCDYLLDQNDERLAEAEAGVER